MAKYFSKQKFIDSEGYDSYMQLIEHGITCIDDIDGHEVINGMCGIFGISDDWTIEKDN